MSEGQPSPSSLGPVYESVALNDDQTEILIGVKATNMLFIVYYKFRNLSIGSTIVLESLER